MPQETCPCGSQRSYNECCEPLHLGEAHATTAARLMRSRYAAFVKAQIDYLIDTLHPSKRAEDDRQTLAITIDNTEWLGLNVVGMKAGWPTDDEGEVEFIAHFRQHGQKRELHERSRFVQESDRWYYLDGEFPEKEEKPDQKLGRNDPCWCGSGKKFKKCHGN